MKLISLFITMHDAYQPRQSAMLNVPVPKGQPLPPAPPHQCKSSGVVFIKRNNADNDLQRRVIKSPFTTLIFSFHSAFMSSFITLSLPAGSHQTRLHLCSKLLFSVFFFVVIAGQRCARMLILASRSRLYQVRVAASEYTRATRTQTGDRVCLGTARNVK